MKILPPLYLFLLALILFATGDSAEARDSRIKLSVGAQTIRAEVARTPEQRSKGLMQRRHLGKNDGMLFVFEQPQTISMWMKNTLIPLSVAFIDDHGNIINIAEMSPQTLDSHSSLAPAKYALEMNAGWFDRHGVLAGRRVEGIEAALMSPVMHKPIKTGK